MWKTKLQRWASILRLLPHTTRGKTRLARYLLSNQLNKGGVEEIQTNFGAKMQVPSLREPIAFHLLIDGIYEPELAQFLACWLKPGQCFIDIGANVGLFTLLASQLVSSQGRVIAIEAAPSIFAYLQHNVVQNRATNVVCHQRAISDIDDVSLEFYPAPDDHFGMGALAPQFDAQPIQVKGFTLDRLIAEEQLQQVALIKVDVEGFEAAVFRGASQLFNARHAPCVVFEFCDWAEERASRCRVGDAQRILLDYGYRLWRLTDFLQGKPPLKQLVLSGFETLVAVKAK